jgi:predicted FMN-binding regulatory protein PaiB
MYIPQHYRADDQDQIFALIKNHSFGILATSQDDLPFMAEIMDHHLKTEEKSRNV